MIESATRPATDDGVKQLYGALFFVLLLASGCAATPPPILKAPSSPLFAAIADGHQTEAVALVKHGANIRQRYGSGETPLDASVQLGEVNVVVALLDAGADIESRLPDGETPLIEAVVYDQPAALAVLLARGANANAGLPDGTTPLLLVWIHKDIDVMNQLISAGAKLDVADEAGCNVACSMFRNIRSREDVEKSKALIKVLVNAGAPLTHDTSFECSNVPQVAMAWGAYFKSELSQDAGRVAEALAYNQCATIQFQLLVKAERDRGRALMEQAKDASYHEAGDTASAVIAGVQAALTSLPISVFIPHPDYSKHTLQAAAQLADELADQYQAALDKCASRRLVLEHGSPPSRAR